MTLGDTLVFDDPPIRERFWTATQHVGIGYPKERLADAFRMGEDFAITRYLRGEPFDAPDVLQGTASRILTALGVPVLSEEKWMTLVEAFLSVPWCRELHPQALPLIEALHQQGFRLGVISDWEDTLPDLLAEMAFSPKSGGARRVRHSRLYQAG